MYDKIHYKLKKKFYASKKNFFFNICFILFHEYWKHWSQYWECLKLDFQGAFYSLHSSRSKRGQNTSGNGPNEALGVGDGQGSLGAAVHGVTKSWTWLSGWTELKGPKSKCISLCRIWLSLQLLNIAIVAQKQP